MANFAGGFKFEIEKIKKRNSSYYSVFIYKWKICRCNAIRDEVVVKSKTELTMQTSGLYQIVKEQINNDAKI